MKQRCISLLLCACLCLGLTVPAFAAGEEQVEREESQEESPYDVTWEELESRVLADGPNALILGENIAALEALDYEKLKEQLREQINELAKAQWQIIVAGAGSTGVPQLDMAISGMASMSAQAAVEPLRQQYDVLRETFDDIKDGTLPEDNEEVIWQLRSGMDRVVSGSQTLYLTVLELEQKLADGERGVAAIDRALAELRLRQELGQVSEQQVESLERTRADTVSQLDTLKNGISSCKSQLQTLIGQSPTGELTLAPLPRDGNDEWTEPDYEADLAAAKEASWDLYSVKEVLDDTKDT